MKPRQPQYGRCQPERVTRTIRGFDYQKLIQSAYSERIQRIFFVQTHVLVIHESRNE